MSFNSPWREIRLRSSVTAAANEAFSRNLEVILILEDHYHYAIGHAEGTSTQRTNGPYFLSLLEFLFSLSANAAIIGRKCEFLLLIEKLVSKRRRYHAATADASAARVSASSSCHHLIQAGLTKSLALLVATPCSLPVHRGARVK